MVFRHRTAFLICLVIFALMVGCSGTGGETPLSPETPDNELTAEVSHGAAGNRYIWEMGEVIIDTEAMTAEVVPLRTADFNLNIVKFLQPPAGNPANLSVVFDLPNCDIPNAYIDLDLTLRHPFPGTVYWGFDVRAIVFGGGSTVGVHDSTVTYPTPTELRMVNADGYTMWWNREFGPYGKIFSYTEGIMAPTFTLNFSKVNGYKYFANGIAPTQMPPNPAEATRGTFSADAVTREFNLQFPQIANPFKFKYSIDASWQQPATAPDPPSSVDDFGPGANTQEAYQVVVTQDPASTAFYDEGSGSGGGDLILDIEVWDWQAEGAAENEIAGIWIESPTLLPGAVEITGSWTLTSPGSSPNSVIYSGTLTDVTPADLGNQELLITVESADPTTYEPPLPNFLYPASPLAAFQLFTCDILPGGKYIRVTSPNGGEVFIIGEAETITWVWGGVISEVVIEYSTDGGATYPNVIVAATPCDGEFEWDPIPDTPTTEARVRITEAGPSPEAQDESDNDFRISETAEPGWNPVPGRIRIPVIDPVPNQSTVTPDFGIQIDDVGNEGAWVVDQEGGIDDGSPYFFDYLLDWSGPSGDAYLSGFNYNFAPFGRHDASSNAIVIHGCSANTAQMNPPVVNDPITAIWYLSYILADETADPGDLHTVTWGDQGSVDPPEDDPDLEPWFHTCDTSGGILGTLGDQLENAVIWVMCYSHEPGAPPIEEDRSGDLNIGFWNYPFLSSNQIYRLGFPDYTTDELPAPFFQAFDVSDPTKIRLGADSNSYIGFDWGEDWLIIWCYMLDSLGNWYGTGFELDFTQGMFGYYGLEASLKIRTDDPEFYIEGSLAVDLEVLPTIDYLYDGDYELGWNWVAVLFDDGTGNFVVRVYEVDWSVAEDKITIVDTTDPIAGTPLSLDVDHQNFTIHVLADNGGTIEATVFDYTP